MPEELRVVVVVPSRNGAGHIASTIAALLAQTRPPAEVIVVDNGSTDATASVASAAGARVVTEPRPGSYAARNAGIAASTGDIVAFTDDDCLPEPGWLAELVTGFADADVVGVGGAIEAVSIQTTAQRWADQRAVLSQSKAFANEYLPYFATANAAYRRSVLDAAGGFDPRLTSGGDVDLAWRVQTSRLGRLQLVPHAIVRHHQRAAVGGLLRQYRRYGSGHGVLDRLWGHDPRYLAAIGRADQRLRAVWLLPVRLVVRLVRRHDLRVPLVDAAARLAAELGRREGRRRAASLPADDHPRRPGGRFPPSAPSPDLPKFPSERP